MILCFHCLPWVWAPSEFCCSKNDSWSHQQEGRVQRDLSMSLAFFPSIHHQSSLHKFSPIIHPIWFYKFPFGPFAGPPRMSSLSSCPTLTYTLLPWHYSGVCLVLITSWPCSVLSTSFSQQQKRNSWSSSDWKVILPTWLFKHMKDKC